MNRTRVILASVAMVAALALTACGGGGDDNPLSSGNSSAAPTDTIVVGSANFPESTLLAQIYAGALTAKGVKVSTKLNIGSRETYIPGLQDGSIDLIPEYSGVLLQYFDKNATQVSSDDVYAALKTKVPAKLTVLDQSTAEDKDSVTVTKATADKYNLKSIADLQSVAGQLTLGGPPEWKTRQTGAPGLKAKYDVVFKEFKSLDAGGPLTINALKNGSIQAGDVFTTDPNIVANGWVALEDPKYLFAAQNVLPLINKAKATQQVTAALNAVSAKLTPRSARPRQAGDPGQEGPGHGGEVLAVQQRAELTRSRAQRSAADRSADRSSKSATGARVRRGSSRRGLALLRASRPGPARRPAWVRRSRPGRLRPRPPRCSGRRRPVRRDRPPPRWPEPGRRPRVRSS